MILAVSMYVAQNSTTVSYEYSLSSRGSRKKSYLFNISDIKEKGGKLGPAINEKITIFRTAIKLEGRGREGYGLNFCCDFPETICMKIFSAFRFIYKM